VSDLEPEFEMLETRLMRAWMQRDAKAIRTLTHNDMIIMFGITPPVLLDQPSFVGGAEGSLRCEGFRFNEMTARKYGKCVWFVAHIDLELRVGQEEWKGKFLLTDLWRKALFPRKWKLAERSLSPVSENEKLSDVIHSMQLWR